MTVARTYAKAQTETASRERLMVMLLQAALRHMNTAARGYQDKKHAAAIAANSKAHEIVTELLATLDPRQAPELCEQLSSIYIFVIDRLMKGLTGREAAPILEAARAFAPIVSAFAEAVQKLERPQAAAPAR